MQQIIETANMFACRTKTIERIRTLNVILYRKEITDNGVYRRNKVRQVNKKSAARNEWKQIFYYIFRKIQRCENIITFSIVLRKKYH